MKKIILFFAGLMACYGMGQAQTITWVHLQWEAATTVSAGSDFEALGLVFADGITNVAEPDGTAIEAQLGYGASANPADAAWTWKNAAYHGVWAANDNISYQDKIAAPVTNGTYYYSFRFRITGQEEWVYAGNGGLWDATDHPCKTFTVTGGTDPTGFSDVETDNNVSGIFDILGRRLMAPQKGINIINGTKIIIY